MSCEDNETVYGGLDDSRLSLEESRIMSEQVEALASSVYKELERVIREYDEEAVKDIMPLFVTILDTLEKTVQEKRESDVELEMIRDDNEQLLTQYEREKQLRKTNEQKYMAYEDSYEEERKQLFSKIESLESIVRLFEIKMKNCQDQISRHEDREAEAKSEYNKLHERYTDLFKAHIDFREKTKLIGSDRVSVDFVQTKRPIAAFMPLESTTSIPGIPDSFSSRIIQDSAAMSQMNLMHQQQASDSTSFDQEVKNMDSRKRKESESRTKNNKETRETDMVTDHINVQDRGTGTSELESLQSPECEGFEGYAHHLGNTGASVFDELSSQDMDVLSQIDDGADIADPDVDDQSNGMSREVENLIQENNELLATKNALNVVKDDLIARVDQLTGEKDIFREEVHSLQVVKEKLKARISELEEELKKVKETNELEQQKSSSTANEDEDDVPMAQRKRFTRVEMARVLLERNQYKERLMELQEAVRWTEMIRAASRGHSDLTNKKRSAIWSFFSNLFSSSAKPEKKKLPVATVRYNSPNTTVKPIVDQSRQPKEKQGTRAKAFDFLQDDVVTDKARKAREQERREQYKQMSAVVKRDDGRLQAYGWSLPPKFPTYTVMDTASIKSPQLPIPIPVYCRPIREEDASTKLWCAAAVNVSGGKTRDGGSVVGASVFYSMTSDISVNQNPAKDEVEKLSQEIENHEKDAKCNETDQTSSLVWICTTNKNGSEVTVIDANNPGDILENFHVSSSHLLCIASIPGAMEDDYKVDDDIIQCKKSSSPSFVQKADEDEPSHKAVGVITFVQCSSGQTFNTTDAVASENSSISNITTVDQLEKEFIKNSHEQGSAASRSRRVLREPNSELIKDGIGKSVGGNRFVSDEIEKSSSILPTMWLGSQSGSIFVHSAVSQWRRCLLTVRLKDSILSISHVKGRVFVAVADGTVAVFRRDSYGHWDLTDFHVITLGEPQHSVRCISIVANKHVWCGYRNTIYILNPRTLEIEKSFDAHPRKESQVRHMSWVGDGVWLSIRLDSTLRLYHAYTHEHLQDIDIEPYVSKLLGNGKLGFSFVRISCLMASCNRLWIGTGNGVILSVPLSDTNDSGILTSLSACNSNKQTMTMASSGVGRPGGVIRVYSDSKTDSVFPGSFTPYCSIAQAQLSFHGHTDAVKFFVTVPGSPFKGVSGVFGSTDKEKEQAEGKPDDSQNLSKNLLVISGGEGYIDFRMGEVEDESLVGDEDRREAVLSKGDHSHLIVWQVFVSS